MKHEKEKILLFIPMYNCAKQIPRVIAQLTDEIQDFLAEVVIIDNGSTDGSREIASEAIGNLRIKASVRLNNQNYSLGGSHKVAFKYAKENGFDYVIVFHGDDQGSIADLLPSLRTGAHRQFSCLLGSRFMAGSKLVGYSGLRTFLNRVINLIFSIICFKRIYDIGSGLNMYDVAKMHGEFYLGFPNTLLFNTYMFLYYVHKKYSVEFFPITWREEDQVSNAKLVPMGFAMLGIIFRYVFLARALLEDPGREERKIDYLSTEVHSNGRGTETSR